MSRAITTNKHRQSAVRTLAAFALAIAALSRPAAAHEDEVLGKVHFANSCSAGVQETFDRAVALQHSFWYQAAYKTFDLVIAADPSCAIAHWGKAMTLLFNPFNQPPAKNLADGASEIAAGRNPAAQSARERDFIDALGAFYVDADKLDHRTRVTAYLKAMEALATKYSDDSEARIFYALALDVAASPADKTYANQLKAAAILEQEFKRQPNHPGVAHYLIHTYDYPPIAQQGLTAAQAYAKIAPSAPHALHMPSHIFTRVGYWNDSIASNTASAKVAAENHETGDQLHAMDYLVYAYLQTAQDAKARATIDEMAQVRSTNPTAAGPFAQAASAARYVIERDDWAGAAALAPAPSKFGFVDAITHFAIGLGAARTGNVALAKQKIAELGKLTDSLFEAKDRYWSEQVDVQRMGLMAWTALAEGNRDEALDLMKKTADAEDATDKSPITPGPLTPARELLGDMLLQLGKPGEALAQYEATLKKEPNRFRATFGAAKAAAASGDAAKAKARYAELLKIAADGDRPVLAQARQFLAAN